MRKPCAAIFMTPVIQWNGDVTTCCHDPKIELKIGNINETPLDELWNSPEMTKRRIMQINGDFSYPSKCLNCKNVDGLSITDEQVIDYLISNGREDLINNYATLHKFNLKPKFKVLAKTSEIIEIDPFMPRAQSWDENFGKYLGEDGFKKIQDFSWEKKLPLYKDMYARLK
jgi:radical SAM protein with 4Fe4S-binding SPASM domain